MMSFPSAITGPLKPWPRGLVQTIRGAPAGQVAATCSSAAAAPHRVGPRNWGQSPARAVIAQDATSQSAGRVALRNIERRGGTVRSSRRGGSGSSEGRGGGLRLHAGASSAPPRIASADDPGRRRACPGGGGGTYLTERQPGVSSEPPGTRGTSPAIFARKPGPVDSLITCDDADQD